MGVNDAFRRTPRGYFVTEQERVTEVERRLAAGPADTGWIDLASDVTFGAGWSYVADAGAWAGLRGRRRSGQVQLILANVRAAAATFTVPLTGNIVNSLILSDLPERLRPRAGSIGVLTGGSAGPVASFYVDPDGRVFLSAVVPDPTQTGSVANVQTDFSAVGTYFV